MDISGTAIIYAAMLLCIIFAALVLLYLLMLMPRMRHKPATEPFRHWLYAHRGLHDNASEAPENSLPAFAKAVEAGYGIELDIRLTKDKIPVVFHDETLRRICRGAEGRVCDYTCEELQRFTLCDSDQHIPEFEEVLKLVDGKVPLIVEFKLDQPFDLELCPIADALLADYQGIYCMESFNPFGLWWYRLHRGDILRGQLSDGFLKEETENTYKKPVYFALQNLLLNFIAKPDFVAYNHKYHAVWSRRLCRFFYRNLAVAWTIRNEEELQNAAKYFDLFIFEGFRPGDK